MSMKLTQDLFSAKICPVFGLFSNPLPMPTLGNLKLWSMRNFMLVNEMIIYRFKQCSKVVMRMPLCWTKVNEYFFRIILLDLIQYHWLYRWMVSVLVTPAIFILWIKLVFEWNPTLERKKKILKIVYHSCLIQII